MTDDETIARIAVQANEDGRISLHDADILFGRISQLQGALKMHKEAIAVLTARDALMLGVRNDLQYKLEQAEHELSIVHRKFTTPESIKHALAHEKHPA